MTQAYSEDLTLEYLKHSLLSNHQMLKSQSLLIEAQRSEAKSLGRLPNPLLKYGLFPNEISTKNGLIKSKVSISQEIIPKARLHFKKQAALNVVNTEQLQKDKTLQDLILNLEKTFFTYNFLSEKVEILQDNLKLVNSWIKLWETHYSHHNFQYQRLIQLQVDAREIEDSIRSVQDQIPIVYQELMELAWIESSEPQKVKFNREIIAIDKEFDLETNIDLQIISSLENEASTKVKLANSLYKPKYSLASEWTMIESNGTGVDQGKDAWMVSLGMELVLDKRRVEHRVDSAKSKVQSLQHKKNYIKRHLRTQFKKKLFKLKDARLKYQLIKDDLLPRTREALDSIQASYTTQSKGIDFFSLLSHLRKLLKLNLDMSQQYKNYFQKDAELKRILGKIGEN